MKTSITSRKILSISTVLAGALLLLSPSISAAFAQNSFTYNNPGEQAFLNVTNNAGGASFTITGAFSHNDSGLNLFATNGTFTNSTTFNLGESNGTTYFNGFGVTGSINTTYTGNPGNFSGYYLTSPQLTNILENLQSVYLITGSGFGDLANVTNGLTNDIYSIVLPGFAGTVDVQTGAGSSTYAIQVGPNSTVTITQNAGFAGVNLEGANNVFNIVYGNPNGCPTPLGGNQTLNCG